MIMRSQKLNNIVCFFDQALYTKTGKLVWKHKDNFSGLVLRLGTFHKICILLGIICKSLQGAEVDLYVEVSVVASESIAGVMKDKKYNRVIRVHKLCYKAHVRLLCKGFFTSFKTDQEDVDNTIGSNWERKYL